MLIYFTKISSDEILYTYLKYHRTKMTYNSSPYSKAPQVMTAHKVEKLTQIRRNEERRVDELLRYSSESQRLSALAKSETQLPNIREGKNLVKKINEADQERIESEYRDKKLQEKYVKDQTEQFEEERTRIILNQEKMDRDIQLICENSEELKELERNIQIAYVNRARAEQFYESQILQEVEEERELVIEEKMEMDRIASAEKEMLKEEKRREILREQKCRLQQQMAENELRLEKAKAEALRDKEAIDHIISKMNLDMNRELMEKTRKSEEVRKLMKDFEQDRAAMRAAHKKREADEDNAIRVYLDVLQQRQAQEEEQRREEQEKKKYVWSQVSQETERHRSMKKEYDDMRTLLWEEELEERKRQQDQEERLKDLQLKQENMRLNKEQIELKREKIKEYEKEERAMTKLMLEKYAADEENERLKREQMALAKRRLAAEAQRLKDEKQRLYQEEKAREEDELRKKLEQDEYKQRIVSEARKKLLAQHAANIKGFLPKGTLANEDEAAILYGRSS